MQDITGILDPLQIPKSVKADAFDAYHQAASPEELKPKLAKLPLSPNVRSLLHQHKANAMKVKAIKPPGIKPPGIKPVAV
jgi:hypothetical protein